jgi:Flp pilus assembly protein CpaB
MRNSLALIAVSVALAVSAFSAEPKMLPAGRRAVALRLGALKCRYVEAGDDVDMLLTFADKDKVRTTMVILQDAKVLEVKPLSAEVELTLSVTNKGADALALAVKKGGVFTVAARAADDHEVHPLEPATFRRLFR